MQRISKKFTELYRPIRVKVNPLYDQYLGWSFLSNIVMSAEYVMSTHSMLSVLGQSSSQAAFSAAYIGKDIFGQLGGAFYMHRVAHQADKSTPDFVNKFITIQQAAIAVECVTPLLPLCSFVPVAGFANISQNVSATSMGAINARIIQRIAPENIGEVYAKISVLNTLGSTIGMSIGLGMVYLVPCHESRIIFIPALIAARVYTYKRAIRGLL